MYVTKKNYLCKNYKTKNIVVLFFMENKRVYTFGGGHAEGRADMRELLGGKGANLAEMNLIGVPVPPGFTITTAVCNEYYVIGKEKVVEVLREDVKKSIHQIEEQIGMKFGDAKNPLLLSVRSGARASMTGSGEMFTMRDPWGIRPAFWYKDEEQIVIASERPVIQTTLFVESQQINELKPGQALIVDLKGKMRLVQILEPKTLSSCSFERIYFSRGSDVDIYKERKALGRQLLHPILKAIDGDIKHTVFSFIPNTAEVAFYGMIEGFNEYLNKQKKDRILNLGPQATAEQLNEILSEKVRIEKVAWKDIKMRTFIAEGNSRNDLAAHVYDVTYGSLKPGIDNLVIIDDSIVRGTTLRESILRILDRLHPKKIVVVSSSPQIRYPDYYGIDMV